MTAVGFKRALCPHREQLGMCGLVQSLSRIALHCIRDSRGDVGDRVYRTLLQLESNQPEIRKLTCNLADWPITGTWQNLRNKEAARSAETQK